MPKALVHINPVIFNEIFYKEIFPDLNRYQIIFGGSSSGKSVSLAQFIVIDLLAGNIKGTACAQSKTCGQGNCNYG